MACCPEDVVECRSSQQITDLANRLSGLLAGSGRGLSDQRLLVGLHHRGLPFLKELSSFQAVEID